MICGALQTLNEEACEDVLEETEVIVNVPDSDIPQTSVIPPSPENNATAGELQVRFPGSSDSGGAFKSCFSIKCEGGDVGKIPPNVVASNTKTDSTILILEPQSVGQISGASISGSNNSFP